MADTRIHRRAGDAGLPALLWVLAIVGTVPARAQTPTEVVLHNFGRSEGASLDTGVVRDTAGNLYGTARTGGSTYHGAVYKVDTAGHYMVLYSFTGGADGNAPGPVILDPSGNLYGTTQEGGACDFAGGCGVVFELDTARHLKVLHTFTGRADGSSPNGVIRDPAGNLYGTTAAGGSPACNALDGCGMVFKIDAAGNYTVLYRFAGGPSGGNPFAGVVRDPVGNLYGTTFYGGTSPDGVVYKLDPAGHETVLHSFTGKADGGRPSSGVILDSDGNLYGTTEIGGAAGAGVIYKLDPAGQETVLYSFPSGPAGDQPQPGVVRDQAGNLYGTIPYTGTAPAGVVYKLDTSGNYTALYSFTGGADGNRPEASVIPDPAGNLYGTTFAGGASNGGAVYKLSATGQETVLYSFPNGQSGTFPWAGLAGDNGNLYGTATSGGAVNDSGVVYKMDAAGRYTVLHSFTGADGAYPSAVIPDSAGNLYGTTKFGGATTGSCTGSTAPNGCGVVYKLDAAGPETVLYSFSLGADGAVPNGVVRDPAGNFYGTTFFGGITGGSCAGIANPSGCGVVFKLDADGQETVLYAFTGGTDGGYSRAGVIRDSDGNLYGTTGGGGTDNWGVVFKVDAAGNYKVLYNFRGEADGGLPIAGVIRDSAGNLYGTTIYGGIDNSCGGYPYGCGVVYKLDPAGRETVLYSFTGGSDGGEPYAGVILDPAGNLYGTTTTPPVAFELDAAGHYTVLHNFTCESDGCFPYGGVIRDAAGNLYGTADGGGKDLTGVIFKLTP